LKAYHSFIIKKVISKFWRRAYSEYIILNFSFKKILSSRSGLWICIQNRGAKLE